MYKLHRFSNPASRLNVDNPGQLLHPGTKEDYGRLLLSEGVSPVGEDVPLLDTDLVLPILTVTTIPPTVSILVLALTPWKVTEP